MSESTRSTCYPRSLSKGGGLAVSASSIQRICDSVVALDLSMIKMKLMDSKDGVSWAAKDADRAESWYKQFLMLNAMYPEKDIVPNKTIDTFWHFHILDTRKYAEDCESTFGHFVHHYPYFGMMGEDDAQALQNAFAETDELFVKEFGVSIRECSLADAGTATRCNADGGQNCNGGRQCK